MKIREIMHHTKDRGVPCVLGSSNVGEVIRVAVKFPHSRLVYVVDHTNRLLGVITIGSLMRHLYPYHYAEKIHPRNILRNIIVEKASHLMTSKKITASPEDSVDDTLKIMAKTGTKEIAVVDEEGHIVSDITVTDLLDYFQIDHDI